MFFYSNENTTPERGRVDYAVDMQRGPSDIPSGQFTIGNSPQTLLDSPGGTIGDNKIRTITIQQLNYGYSLNVGCQLLAIEKPETIIRLLSEYLNNPYETEKKYYAGKLFD